MLVVLRTCTRRLLTDSVELVALVAAFNTGCGQGYLTAK
jgi:hypothetical protein